MADDDRLLEVVLLDLIGELVSDGREQRSTVERWDAGESRVRDRVVGEAVAVVGDGALPRIAGRGEAGDQNHRPSLPRDLHAERGRLRRGERRGEDGRERGCESHIGPPERPRYAWAGESPGEIVTSGRPGGQSARPAPWGYSSEERRVGKEVDRR